MEWSNQARYNSFNSYKGLTYYEHYQKVVDWFNKKKDSRLPPPIECSLDPTAKCNYNCYYCNSQRYLRQDLGAVPAGRKLTKKYMRTLIDFLAKWGVRGVCLGGGGDSLLSQDAWDLPSYIASKGMESSVVTNGSMFNPHIIRQLLYCRWVGFSVDAGDAETFYKVHGVDLFDKVITNIRALVEADIKEGGKLDIAYKVLVLPENIDSLYDACKLAKKIGVKDFHIRPVDLERKDYRMAQKLNLDIPKIQEIFAKCHELENPYFRVFTVMHKYDEEFHVKHDFERCLASPLVIQCCTDGLCYVCVDHRIEERFKLGRHEYKVGRKLKPEKILDWWGSDAHRELLKSIKPSEECSRCTWSEYNRQIEDTVMEDGLCRSFP